MTSGSTPIRDIAVEPEEPLEVPPEKMLGIDWKGVLGMVAGKPLGTRSYGASLAEAEKILGIGLRCVLCEEAPNM
jgi:hypothetical protein